MVFKALDGLRRRRHQHTEHTPLTSSVSAQTLLPQDVPTSTVSEQLGNTPITSSIPPQTSSPEDALTSAVSAQLKNISTDKYISRLREDVAIILRDAKERHSKEDGARAYELHAKADRLAEVVRLHPELGERSAGVVLDMLKKRLVDNGGAQPSLNSTPCRPG